MRSKGCARVTKASGSLATKVKVLRGYALRRLSNFRATADHSQPGTATWRERWEHVFLRRVESSYCDPPNGTPSFAARRQAFLKGPKAGMSRGSGVPAAPGGVGRPT